MAGTLLSGTNIVYNGNLLNDLSLTAFLDKFMEKKPKQNTWHGGSQIEPSKKAGDESDNEEIENMLDEVDVEEEGGEYDYDDLDRVASDDDEELVADVSDAEMDTDMDMIDDGDVDSDGDYDGRGSKKKQEKRKRKSPFASLEEYEHLIDQDDKDDSMSERKVTSEPKKKKKKKETKASE